jgi:4-hydroxy-tetrahydrodipicolinate synthase
MIFLPDQAFRGAYTPLITPFRDGRVDYGAFAAFVDWQIKEGAQGLVVGGTSAEPMSLTVAERKDLLRIAVDIARQRVPVIAATGAASFADTLDLTAHAESLTVAATLVMTPVFSKPPERGLLDYYLKIAEITRRPFMLYQIPSRTNSVVSLDLCREIAAAAPHFVGMKQSANDREFVHAIIEMLGPDFRVFMGLSEIAWDMVGQGACGLIVALANVVPGAIARLCEYAALGNLEQAAAAGNELATLNAVAFSESNPIPVKYMAWRLGVIPTLEYRMPLSAPTEDLRQEIDDALSALNLI